MNSDQTDTRDRNAVLRESLVELVDASSAQRPAKRSVVYAIAAFGIAGALTGGAISAAAMASAPAETTNISIENMAFNIVGTHTELLGTPFIVSGAGKTVINLGERPTGAEQLAIAFHCVEAGRFTQVIDDDPMSQSVMTCDEESTLRANGGGIQEVNGTGAHTLTLDSSSKYTIWASWAYQPPEPKASVEQESMLSDGTVTAEEYRAAFDTFSTCMTDAGYPLLAVNDTRTIISYSIESAAVDSGEERDCYANHFKLVDMEWQGANEDTSQTADFVRQCLIDHGVAPAPTLKEMEQQLRAISVEIPQCLGIE
jgi:hypothetical protein